MSVSLEKVDLGKIKYLIYSSEDKDSINEEFNKGIIDSNIIPGALPAFLAIEEEKVKVRYHVTDEKSLGEVLQKPIGKRELQDILRTLVDILKLAKEKDINVSNYLLDKDYVFIDPRSKEMYLIYLPLKDNKEDMSVRNFIKDIISIIKYDLNEDLYFFVNLHNYLNEKGFTIEGLENLLDSKITSCQKQREVINIERVEKVEAIQDDELSFEEDNTTILDEFDEEAGTTILGLEEDYKSGASIERISSGEIIELYKDEFKVGRDKNSCDFIIDNKSVGRLHAVLTRKNGQYYILDNSSRNGTFLNDRKIISMTEYSIKNGDEIRLANETFIFKLY